MESASGNASSIFTLDAPAQFRLASGQLDLGRKQIVPSDVMRCNMKVALMIFLGFFFCSMNAQAQTPFYQGKTITVIIGTPPGNLYDLWGRLIVAR
jgi:hypothetical protein